MARDEIDLDVGAAISAARALSEAGDALSGTHGSAAARIESAHDARPWGHDELGDAFARGYSDAAAQVLSVWRDVAQRTRQLADEIDEATRATVETDRVTSEVIDNVPRAGDA